MRTEQHQEYNRVLNEVSSLILSIFRSPGLPSGPLTVQRVPDMTPSGFAALLMGVSVSLMFCGSVTFFIGFMLMPWVLGLVMILYVFGVLSTLSFIARAILCCNVTSSSRKEGPGGGLDHGLKGLTANIILGSSFLLLLSPMWPMWVSRYRRIVSPSNLRACVYIYIETIGGKNVEHVVSYDCP